MYLLLLFTHILKGLFSTYMVPDSTVNHKKYSCRSGAPDFLSHCHHTGEWS